MPRGPNRLKKGHERTRGRTVASDLLASLIRARDTLEGRQWPAAKWQRDPAGFIHEVFGVTLVIDWQKAFVDAVVTRDRMSIAAGQKVGKTFVIAAIAWWYFCCFPRAKCVLFATNEKQIDTVLWPELRKLLEMARTRGYDLLAGGSVMAEDPQTGIEALDGRVIRGLSGHKTEAFGGISGGNLLFIVDEASSLTQRVYEAIVGNTKGGRRERLARVCLFGNPLQPEGPFYDTFHELKHTYWHRNVSSLDVARQAASLGIDIEGLATVEACEADIAAFGKDSPQVITRIFGQFLRHETGKVNPYHVIVEAQKRWERAASNKGRLGIGVDPAGPKNEGDEWAFCATRGYKCLDDIVTRRGYTSEQGVAMVEELVAKYRIGDEIPIVVVDTLGEDGWKFYCALKERAEWVASHHHTASYEVVRFRGSDKATRAVEWYERERDVLWAYLAKWLRDGGAIPPDYKLETELHAPMWHCDVNGKYFVTKKEGSGGLRQILNRSPDRADSLALSVYRPSEESPAEENAHGDGGMAGQKFATDGGDVYDVASSY